MGDSVHFATRQGGSYSSGFNGFPFQIIDVAVYPPVDWTELKAACLGPLTLQQAIGMFWRVSTWRFQFTAQVYVQQYNWMFIEDGYGYYEPGEVFIVTEEIDEELQVGLSEKHLCTRDNTFDSKTFSVGELTVQLDFGAFQMLYKDEDSYYSPVVGNVYVALQDGLYQPRMPYGPGNYVGDTGYYDYNRTWAPLDSNYYMFGVGILTIKDSEGNTIGLIPGDNAYGILPSQFTAQPSKYWPYKNAAGDAVFETNTGTQINPIS